MDKYDIDFWMLQQKAYADGGHIYGQKGLAARIGVSESTMWSKLTGHSRGGFTQCEILNMCRELGIPVADIPKYFFDTRGIDSCNS